MPLDLSATESITEAHEIGPVVEILIGDALWRLSARRDISPAGSGTWVASYERRKWINVEGVATWHWVSEGRLPTAEASNADDCLQRALSQIEEWSLTCVTDPGLDE